MKRHKPSPASIATTSLVMLFLSATASAQTPLSVDTGKGRSRSELNNPQPHPSGPRPTPDQRPGTLAGHGNSHVGEAAPPALDDDDPPADAQPTPPPTDDAAAASTPIYYHAYGSSEVALPNRNDYLCSLHRVRGVMGEYTLARMRYFDNGTQVLTNELGPEIWSTAACVPKSKFYNHSPQPISTIFDTKYQFVQNGSIWYPEEWGNAAALLTGIGGPFRELGDRAWVWQEPVDQQNVADITSEGSGYIVGYTTAFWFNESSGPQKAIKFIGPYSTGDAAQTGEYHIAQNTKGVQAVNMAKTSEAFCYLTGINGGLAAFSDGVSIILSDTKDRYVLRVRNSSGLPLHAYARCMAFDQR